MIEKFERILKQWETDLNNGKISEKYRKRCVKDIAKLRKELDKIYGMYGAINRYEEKVESWLDTIV